jgi:hypothetical protein
MESSEVRTVPSGGGEIRDWTPDIVTTLAWVGLTAYRIGELGLPGSEGRLLAHKEGK